MWSQYFVGIQRGLAILLLGGMVAASALAADGQAISVRGAPTVPPEPNSDAALRLASRSLSPSPPPEEKKSPWWAVFSSKKDSTSSAAPDQSIEPPPTGKFKASKAETKSTPMFGSKNSKDSSDKGQEEIAARLQERQYSEADYIASATLPRDTKAKNLYNDGLLAESQGRIQDATRAYNGFIKANERSTTNGVLAAPYHRLALISWKEGSVTDTEAYFRYALNYALGGNLLIIGADYAQYLMGKGHHPKAEIILRNTLLNDPENKRLLLLLGRCVALQKKHQEALRYLDASVGRTQAYLELAAIYRLQGDFELARVAEEKRNAILAPHRPQPPAPIIGSPPNNAFAQAAVAVQQQLPPPTLERQPDPQATSMGWEPSPQAPDPQPAAVPMPSTPVSRVYHYPSNSPNPVYYQYTGNEYPQSPSAHPWGQPTMADDSTAPNNIDRKWFPFEGWQSCSRGVD